MICICHKNNTVDKEHFEDKTKVEYKICEYDKQLIKDSLGIFDM